MCEKTELPLDKLCFYDNLLFLTKLTREELKAQFHGIYLSNAEFSIHWSSPEDSCDKLAADPEKYGPSALKNVKAE